MRNQTAVKVTLNTALIKGLVASSFACMAFMLFVISGQVGNVEDSKADNVYLRIYSEDFNNYANGTTSSMLWDGEADKASSLGEDFYFEVRGSKWIAQAIGDERTWSTEEIDIKGHETVGAVIVFSEKGKMESDDYIRAYYSLDGGPEVMFDVNGDKSGEFNYAIASQSDLAGETLQLIVKVKNDDFKEKHFFDNVFVTGIDDNGEVAIPGLSEEEIREFDLSRKKTPNNHEISL